MPQFHRRLPNGWALAALVAGALSFGCDNPPPIRTYVIPTRPPAALSGSSSDRMLAAVVTRDDGYWSFKVTGPADAIAAVEPEVKSFVETVPFDDGEPDLRRLPVGWRRSGGSGMRFASINIDTPGKQLDMSVMKLPRRGGDDAAMLAGNVNRWRGQLGLESSDTPLGGGEPIEAAGGQGPSVWVDLVGTMDGGSMMPQGSSPGAVSGSPPTRPVADRRPPPRPAAKDDRVTYDKPDGWREVPGSSMRLVSMGFGPEDAAAELTVIPAGGDVRGNVARWLGQISGGQAEESAVDAALESAEDVRVDGRNGQRFLLRAPEAVAEDRQAIDATIVPTGDGFSLFIKATGPEATVVGAKNDVGTFLNSLKVDL